MALKLNERYPGRFDNPSVDYPQGSFKNRTTPTAKDGSYLEKDWANDKEGFFQSLIDAAGIVPSGLVDKVGASQLFDALKNVIASTAAGRLLNIKVFTASGTYTPTAGTKSVIVEVQGAGGGGGGTPATGPTSTSVSGSGGSGSYAKARLTSGFSGVAVTVGTSGAGGTAGLTSGGNGGTSSFGALVSAPGGIGGQSLAAGTPPMTRGGSAYATPPSGGNIESRTGVSGGGNTVISGSVATYAGGAGSRFGEGGVTGLAAGGPGAGGGGAVNLFSAAAIAGGAGGAGLVIVWEYS